MTTRRYRLRQLAHQVIAAGSTSAFTTSDEAASAAPSAAQGIAAEDVRLLLTTPEGPLTFQQRQQYERDGYLVVREFWEPAQLQHLHEHYVEICRNAVEMVKSPAARVASLVRDINVVDGTHDLGELPIEYGVIKLNGFVGAAGEDEVFCSFARNEKQLRYVYQFVGSEELDTFSEMYVCKPPGLDSAATTRHPIHQDLLYVPRGERDYLGRLSAERHGYSAGNSARNGIVCAYTAVKRATVDNGCLMCIPGSHQKGLRYHSYPVEGQLVDPSGKPWVASRDGKNNIGYFGCSDISADEMESLVALELAPGDTVFFHPELLHGSGINRVPFDTPTSDKQESFRAAIALHYVRADLSRYQPSGAPIWAEVPVGKAVIDADTADKGRVAYGSVAYRSVTTDEELGRKDSVESGERIELARKAAEDNINGTHQLTRTAVHE